MDIHGLLRLPRKREPEANRVVAKTLLGVAVLFAVVWVLYALRVLATTLPVANVVVPSILCVLISASVITLANKGSGVWIKYMLLIAIQMFVFGLNVVSCGRCTLLLALPVVLSVRYSNLLYTLFSGGMSCLLSVIGAFFNAYIAPDLGLLNPSALYLGAQDIYPVPYVMNAVPAELDRHQLLLDSLRTEALAGVILTSAITLCCIVLIRYGAALMTDAYTALEKEKAVQLELSAVRTRNAVSQIQPHFLYNTLNAIMAIEGNPDDTVDALTDFGKYLRENLDTMTGKDIATLREELEHVKRYIKLEKLRFGDRLNIEYRIDIPVDIGVPTLCVQMLVENAVKHGIMTRKEGGTVRVTACEDVEKYTVYVIDDGVGFDPSKRGSDAGSGRTHCGLDNVRSRLETLCGGRLTVVSKPGKGTTAMIIIPKEKKATA